MNNVGAIGTNYTPVVQHRQQKENPKQDIKEQSQGATEQKSSVNPDAVFDFMAANNNVSINKPQSTSRVIKISDYVTPEQAQRIAGFVTGFENEVAQGLSAINSEFPEMSEEMSMALALASFESEKY